MLLKTIKEQEETDDVSLETIPEIKETPLDHKFVPMLPEILKDGLDEMNFAEFPMGVVGNRVDPSVKTLLYVDTIFDKAQGKDILRRVMITGSDAFGLPTATDEEVFLALIQLSKQQSFESQVILTRSLKPRLTRSEWTLKRYSRAAP